MQAQLKYHSLLLICTLLIGIVSTPLLTWSSLADAAATHTPGLAHTVQVQSIVQVLAQNRPQATHTGSKMVQFSCQSNHPVQPTLCYGPYQIRQAYGVTNLLAQHITGQGSTIVIIDAYGSPTIQHDLHAFDTQWGLVDPPFHVLTPYGIQRPNTSWEPEVSMDVEWAHVMAPHATID
ncbi:MAG: hypothetical protein ACRDHZ_20815, partial [Ktedonobacteraceae bacterium]